jgi:hypothetical protein
VGAATEEHLRHLPAALRVVHSAGSEDEPIAAVNAQAHTPAVLVQLKDVVDHALGLNKAAGRWPARGGAAA